jgi:putative endonuclease
MGYTRDFGMFGETLVVNVLKKRGVTILERNYTVRGGEIDIIASKNGILCFIEVKTRTAQSNDFSEAVESVTKAKQKRIIKAAKYYIYKTGNVFQPRFDVVEIVIDNKKLVKFNYIADAFML